MSISHSHLSGLRYAPYLILFSIVSFLHSSLSITHGQTNVFRAGAREAAMANTGVALRGNWSLFHNPAGLANLIAPNIGVHYTNQFMMQELSTSSIAGVLPFGRGGFGITGSYFGTQNFNEQRYAFGYAHQLGKLVNAGISIDYYRANLPEDYDPSQALAGDIGLMINPIGNLSIGCHLYNITGSGYKDYVAENLPSFFTLGAAWQSDIFLVTSQVSLDKEQSPIISAGTEVYLIPDLAVRIGISNDKQYQYSFGMGYRKSKFSGDIAFSQHPVLGFSSYVSFNYSFVGKSQ